MKIIFFLIVSTLLYFFPYNGFSQVCLGTTQWPTTTVNAPDYLDTLIVATDNWAGDYYVVNGFVPGKTYKFTSSKPGDQITLTDNSNNLIWTSLTPLTITLGPSITSATIYRVHITLPPPGCGSEQVVRTTKIICSTCIAPSNVGIGTSNPANSAKLDVHSTNQGLKIPTMSTTQRNSILEPVEGLIVYDNSQDVISMYNGAVWKDILPYAPPAPPLPKQLLLSAKNFMPPWNASDLPGNGKYKMGVGRAPREGNLNFHAPLNLPVGTIIHQITYHYFDNLTNSSVGLVLSDEHLSSTNSNGNVPNTVFQSSTPGAVNSIQSASVYPNYTLEGGTYYWFLLTFETDNDTDQGLRGITITYTEPY